MIQWTLFAVVLALILGLLLLMKLTHGIFRLLSFIISFFIVAGLVLGIIVVYDAFSFQQKAFSDPMVYVLTDGTVPVTEIIRDPNADNTFIMLSDSDAVLISQGSYDELLSKYFKVWEFSPGVVEGLPGDEYPFSYYTLTKQELQAILFKETHADYNGTAAELRAAAFASIVVDEVAMNPVFMLRQYKMGNIAVHKESIVFKFVKYLPVDWIQRMFSRATQEVAGIAEDQDGIHQ
jgi:hypothetical protein